ncbi:hypothetical protein SAMN02799631_01961 [Methylobacterium sp. 174MFSha1.1]|uniref:hypothetical protein n=1 Tax=Methylobacterium sp. 174MFSha1.1 TaxID=1502749 RepID=UPI0008F2651F|nr:hypothetical protein [Methylobacterium sp. 174MFSha1.1]SFU72114.1 hypothetical protein SAMN02799631_01961 [Methylobacterium sp. 174MFSha1.1]
MAEEQKPINPLERRETIGIEDGNRHDGEAVTPSRHGTGTDRGGAKAPQPAPKATPSDAPQR